MEDTAIQLVVSPQQARAILAVLVMAKQFFAVPPNTAVYPNLGDFPMERDLVKAEIGAAEQTVREQMEKQMPE